jgi:hypothetical protein
MGAVNLSFTVACGLGKPLIFAAPPAYRRLMGWRSAVSGESVVTFLGFAPWQ